MAIVDKLNRRTLLKLTGLGGAGLALQASLTTEVLALTNPAVNGGMPKGLELNVFIHIGTDDRVTLVAHRSEMGQGIRTSLPQILADELEADWSKVDIVQAHGDEKYGNQDTDGSRSVRTFFHTMREMGASAKLMLRQAAAKQWAVPLDQCVANNHRILHLASKRSLSFGELATAAAKLPVPDPKILVFKDKKDFKYIGKPMAMVDLQDMVTGRADFGIDVTVADMVYASIERCPVLGGKVKSFDATKTKSVKGVLDVVKIDGGVEPAGFNALAGIAVIATNTWAAQEGRKLLKIDWELGAHSSYDSTAAIAELAGAVAANTKVVRERGDVDKAFKEAKNSHQAVYTIPHLEHATMEPPAATARITGDKCEVWACVQSPVRTRDVVAAAIGFKPEQVDINVTLLGGAFGRKSKPDFVAEAALLAKATGKPVKVTWTREDAVRHGYYHAFSVQHYKAAIDANRQISAMESTVASPSIMSLFQPGIETLQDFELGMGFANTPYKIPNLRARNTPVAAHTRIGWLRSVYHINHAFAANSFIDEIARMNKRDPLQYQLATIGEDRIVDTSAEGFANLPTAQEFPFKTARLKQALQAVKKSSGWPAKVKANEGWGVAVHGSFLSYVAVATKVRLDKKELKLLEVHIAIDCGQVVNPDRVHSQMEGAVIFGLSGALFGDIQFKDGAVQQSNFDDYPMLRLNQSPKIVVTLIASDEKHSGVGEPGVPPIAASVTSAIAAAGGPRIRDLPIVRHLKML